MIPAKQIPSGHTEKQPQIRHGTEFHPKTMKMQKQVLPLRDAQGQDDGLYEEAVYFQGKSFR
jgi:hypothetical protein